MGQHTAGRSLGTILIGLGLVLVLMVAGYFIWSDVQSAQVRAELQRTTLGAAAHAAGVPTEAATAAVAPASARVSTEPTENERAQGAAVAAVTPTRTRTPVPPTATRRPAMATRAPSVTPVSPTAAAESTAYTAALAAVTPLEPVRMTIPDLKIDAKVVPMGWEIVHTKNGPVSQWVIPKNEAGHHINSAGIGAPGNLVISGHNNIYGQVFRPISLAWDNDSRVKVDDITDKSSILDNRRIELFDAQGNKYSYTITGFYRLKDTGVSQAQRIANGKYILPTEDERVTLVTCWPPTNNTHRLIVIAEPEK